MFSNWLSYSSLTNHKCFFKCRWNPWEIPLGMSFVIKCSHLVRNYIGVFSSRVVVGILQHLYIFLQNTSEQLLLCTEAYSELCLASGMKGFPKMFLRQKAVDYVCGTLCLGCLDGYWVRLSCSFKEFFTDSVVCNFFFFFLLFEVLAIETDSTISSLEFSKIYYTNNAISNNKARPHKRQKHNIFAKQFSLLFSF